MNENLPRLRKKSASLPLSPGVYLMKNKDGEIVYVGKAKALKNRVGSYFGSQNNHTVKVRKMVENVFDFDCVVCGSEFEALVLECSLIKRYSPKYNVLLKDDKGYYYIKIAGSDGWKNVFAVKQRFDDGAEYIGPYVDSFGVTNAVDAAKKIFLLPQCSKVFPRDYNRSRPCLNYYIGLCAAPCAGKISREEYARAVEGAIDFIVKGSKKTLDEFKERMSEASENLEFEKAAKFRDKIKAIKKISEKQKVVSVSAREQDVFAIVRSDAKACVAAIRFKDFRLYDGERFIIDFPENLPETRREVLRGYYSSRRFVPAAIVLDGQVEDEKILSEWLSSLAGRKVSIIVPRRGERRYLVEMCRANAAQGLAILLGGSGEAAAALDELGSLLGLKAPPKFIEAYDISHTGGTESAAGMVVFKDGVPYKKSYRRFAIKNSKGGDDCASMAETLERRILRYFDEKDSGEGFGRLPDLILLDGGKAQVNAVKPTLEKYGINVPVFGMVKDSRHKTRALIGPDGEIPASSGRAAPTLAANIQEEVHRYASEYHGARRKKIFISSSLLSIDGIGEARSRALLKEFKTLKAVSRASVEELSRVKGMNRSAAEAVFKAFRGKNSDGGT